MEKDSKTILNDLREDLLGYLDTKLKILKLDSYEKTSKLVSLLLYSLILLFFSLFATLFLFITLGLFLGEILKSITLGFLLVTALYILAIVIIYVCRKKIRSGFINIVLNALNDND